jgi:hypothetical protein
MTERARGSKAKSGASSPVNAIHPRHISTGESPMLSTLNPAAPGASPIAPGGQSRRLTQDRLSRLYAKQLVSRLRRCRSSVPKGAHS